MSAWPRSSWTYLACTPCLSSSVAQVVEAGALREPGPLQEGLEVPLQVAGRERRADAGGEHEPLILPEPGAGHALLQLALAVGSEGCCGLPGEPDAAALAGLGGLEDAPATGLGERAPDLEHAGSSA